MSAASRRYDVTISCAAQAAFKDFCLLNDVVVLFFNFKIPASLEAGCNVTLCLCLIQYAGIYEYANSAPQQLC